MVWWNWHRSDAIHIRLWWGDFLLSVVFGTGNYLFHWTGEKRTANGKKVFSFVEKSAGCITRNDMSMYYVYCTLYTFEAMLCEYFAVVILANISYLETLPGDIIISSSGIANNTKCTLHQSIDHYWPHLWTNIKPNTIAR